MLRIKCRSTFSNNVSCITKHGKKKLFFLPSTSPRSFNLNPNVSPSLPLKFSYDIMEFTLFTNHRKLIFFFFIKLNTQPSYTNSVQKLQLQKYSGRNRRLAPIVIELPDFRKRRSQLRSLAHNVDMAIL